jgi:hypothetical protein
MEFLREGGWPMYPTFALGFGGLALSLRYAMIPQRSLRPLALGLLAATFVMGFLGTVLGVQASARGIVEVPPENRWLFLIGLKEASNCLAAALALILPGALALGAGSHRMSRRLEEIATRAAT